MPQKDLSPVMQHLLDAAVAVQKRDETLFLHRFSELHAACEHFRDEEFAARILEIIPTLTEAKHMDWRLREAVIDRLQELK